VNQMTTRMSITSMRMRIPTTSGRVVRSWTGFEANVPDFYPLAGALPSVEGVFVLGCVRGGYTIGPYISKLMGDFILGREPELPLFDPARTFETE
jgi:sarcosine oxidase, subunit beta